MAFIQSGRSIGEFPGWTEMFMGANRPVDDIIGYLDERFSVRRRGLADELQDLQDANWEFSQAVQEAWIRIHERRRERRGDSENPIVVGRLSRHDAENYAGVVALRNKEKPSPFGYSAWWLTLDRLAFTLGEVLKRDFGIPPFDSPVLSVDFLAQYLAFGPMRGRLSKEALRTLPVAIEPRLIRFLSRDLLDEAAKVRAEMNSLPEAVIRRRVRDTLDNHRRRRGPLAEKGVESVLDEIRQSPSEGV